eukprot:gene17463-24158_t
MQRQRQQFFYKLIKIRATRPLNVMFSSTSNYDSTQNTIDLYDNHLQAALTTKINSPLVEKYRSIWPSPEYGNLDSNDDSGNVDNNNDENQLSLVRTIPDEVLRFRLKASFSQGSALFYPHLPYNPADFKVALMVTIDDLNLSKKELGVLIRMVGPRYNTGKREIKLTADKFPNRIENKRYLTILLENLVAEAKKLSACSHEYKIVTDMTMSNVPNNST